MRNYRRVIETWWDEYKEYFYVSRPESRTLDYGDLSVQHKFRKDHWNGLKFSRISQHRHVFYETGFQFLKAPTLSSGSWTKLHMVLSKNIRYRRSINFGVKFKAIREISALILWVIRKVALSRPIIVIVRAETR